MRTFVFLADRLLLLSEIEYYLRFSIIGMDVEAFDTSAVALADDLNHTRQK